MSPDLFSLYSESILREVEELHGVVINGRNVNNIRYVDDTVSIAETEKDLQHILDKVIEESESLGLALNMKKTHRTTASKMQNPPKRSYAYSKWTRNKTCQKIQLLRKLFNI